MDRPEIDAMIKRFHGPTQRCAKRFNIIRGFSQMILVSKSYDFINIKAVDSE